MLSSKLWNLKICQLLIKCSIVYLVKKYSDNLTHKVTIEWNILCGLYMRSPCHTEGLAAHLFNRWRLSLPSRPSVWFSGLVWSLSACCILGSEGEIYNVMTNLCFMKTQSWWSQPLVCIFSCTSFIFQDWHSHVCQADPLPPIYWSLSGNSIKAVRSIIYNWDH